jgi:hypothetical protein
MVVTDIFANIVNLLQEYFMCLICVEYNKKRMTREEIKKALPEMVMFAKTEEDKQHFKKLIVLGDSLDEKALEEFANDYTSTLGKKAR